MSIPKYFIFFVLSLFQSFTFVLIGNSILEIKGMLWPYWLILFSASFFSNLLGLNVSNNMKTVVAIYILIPLLLVPQMLLGGAMVKFDKLNNRISTQKYVPVIGDIITARWAYEALMVYQFRYNKYQAELFEPEQNESHAAFYIDYLIPEVQTLADQCLIYRNDPGKKLRYSSFLLKIRTQLEKISSSENLPLFEAFEKLNEMSYSEQVHASLQNYLIKVTRYFSKELNSASLEKDQKLEDMASKIGGKDALILLHQQYYNNAVADIVMNKNDRDNLVYYKNEIIRKKEPVYQLPAARNGRAHFFAPEKKLGRYYLNTFWFNVMAIWMMNLVLYLFLQRGMVKIAGSAIKSFAAFKKNN
ncbi:MAG: ABC transporter permease [Bacteroidales bacterium]|nr:ABC transporter permease [Bacteroidales bacterium]